MKDEQAQKWKLGDCELCGATPEDWEWHTNEPLVLVDYHGTMLCPDCIAEEKDMADRDAKAGIATLWFDDTKNELIEAKARIAALEHLLQEMTNDNAGYMDDDLSTLRLNKSSDEQRLLTRCTYCNKHWWTDEPEFHVDECPVSRARNLLNQAKEK